MLIAIEAGAKDTDPAPGATAEARTAPAARPDPCRRGGAGHCGGGRSSARGQAGSEVVGETAGCEQAPRPGAKASAHHAIDEVEGHHTLQATLKHWQQLGHHRLVERVGQVGIAGGGVHEGHREAVGETLREALGRVAADALEDGEEIR